MTDTVDLTEQDILHIHACKYADKRKAGYYDDVGKNLGTRLDPLTYGWVWLAHREAYIDGHKAKLAAFFTVIDEVR